MTGKDRKWKQVNCEMRKLSGTNRECMREGTKLDLERQHKHYSVERSENPFIFIVLIL